MPTAKMFFELLSTAFGSDDSVDFVQIGDFQIEKCINSRETIFSVTYNEHFSFFVNKTGRVYNAMCDDDSLTPEFVYSALQNTVNP